MKKTIDTFISHIVSLNETKRNETKRNETKRNEQTNGTLCKKWGGTLLMF